jgi:hypothetical protein
LKRPPLEKEGT